MTEDKKIKFSIIKPTNTPRYSWMENNKNTHYVKNGEDNLFPQHLINLYNNSSVHGAAVNAVVEAIVGQGLTANVEDYTKKANRKGESWNDIFAKVAIDYKLHGSFALEVIYSNDRSTIEIYHIDYSLLRAKEKDHRGHIPGYYISTDWDKKAKFRVTSGQHNDEEIFYLPSYDPSNIEETNQIYVKKSYRPGQEYYPLPDYVGALRIIEMDQEVDNFHLSNLKNGLTPSLMITTFTNGNEDGLREIEENLRGNYGGTDNAGNLMYIDVASRDEAPIVTPINSNGTDEYYSTVNDLITQKILTAHRITSPMLLGIKTEGQLGGRTEMIDAYSLFMTMVIEPMQQDILRCLEMLMQYNHPDAVLGVTNTQLFPDGNNTEEIVTDADTTDAEEIVIEQTEL
jgi:hypothetical protein